MAQNEAHWKGVLRGEHMLCPVSSLSPEAAILMRTAPSLEGCAPGPPVLAVPMAGATGLEHCEGKGWT